MTSKNEWKWNIMGCGASAFARACGIFSYTYQQKVDFLGSCPLFDNLTIEQLLDLSNCALPLKFFRGQKPKLSLSGLYLVSQGELKVSIATKGTSPQKSHFSYILVKGQMVHPLYQPQKFLNQSKNCIDYLCLQTTTLLHFDAGALEKVECYHKEISDSFSWLLNSLRNGLYTQLSPLLTFLLRAATHLEVKGFIDQCFFERFSQDNQVFSEGDVGAKLYYILLGSCAISVGRPIETISAVRKNIFKQESHKRKKQLEKQPTPKRGSVFPELPKNESQGSGHAFNEDCLVGVLKDQDFCGLTSLVFPTPRSYSLMAITETLFFTIDSDTFNQFLSSVPSIKEALSQLLKERALRRAKHLGVAFLSSLHEDAFPEFARFCNLHFLHRGQQLPRVKIARPLTVTRREVTHNPVRQSVYVTLQGKLELTIDHAGASCQGRRDSCLEELVLMGVKRNVLQRNASPVVDLLTPGSFFFEGVYFSSIAPLGNSGNINSIAIASVAKKSQVALTSINKVADVTVKGEHGAVILEISKQAEQVLERNLDATTQYQICLYGDQCFLQDILRNEKGTFYFRSFLLRLQESSENPDELKYNHQLDFLLETLKWQERSSIPVPAVKLMAELIFTTYIEDNSPFKVELASASCNDIANAIKTYASSATVNVGLEEHDLFEEAFREVFERIERGPFIEFKKSFEFVDLMNSFITEKWSGSRKSFLIPQNRKSKQLG